MRKLFFTLILVVTFLIAPSLYAANQIIKYGFEDWDGEIPSTPGYIFTSNYSEFCSEHANASEVITSYDGWTPHSGSYFWLQNDSPAYALNPAVNGITTGDVQANNNIGAAGAKCGDDSLNISSNISTGEIFIRFWARNNGGFATIQNGGRCKWIFVATDSDHGIYMHLSTSSTSPSMYFYNGDEGYWLGSSVVCPNAYDGNWHKWSFHIDFNNGIIRGWYDVENETAENATKSWQAGNRQIGSCTKATYVKIQGNFSAKSPTEETYHALDDIEIWDGMPDSGDDNPPGDVTAFTAQAGDGQVDLSWTNPTDSNFKGTMIRYSTKDDPYPATQNDGVIVCDREANPGSSDSFPATGLDNGTKYNFSAFTYDETGNYSETAHVSATPFHCANVYTKTFGDISSADFPQTCKDTFLNAGEAGVTYSSNSEYLNTYTWPTNTAANRIVMKWDLSALPQDAIIQEATLSLYMHSYGGDDNYEITAHKIINHNPDISSCTWNTYDDTNSWTSGANGGEQDIASAESSTIVDEISGYKNWNVTQMVQEWVDNSSTNLGLMLNSDTTAASGSNRYFRPSEYSSQDQRPVLTIKYCGSDTVPAPSAPTGLTVVD